MPAGFWNTAPKHCPHPDLTQVFDITSKSRSPGHILGSPCCCPSTQIRYILQLEGCGASETPVGGHVLTSHTKSGMFSWTLQLPEAWSKSVPGLQFISWAFPFTQRVHCVHESGERIEWTPVGGHKLQLTFWGRSQTILIGSNHNGAAQVIFHATPKTHEVYAAHDSKLLTNPVLGSGNWLHILFAALVELMLSAHNSANADKNAAKNCVSISLQKHH